MVKAYKVRRELKRLLRKPAEMLGDALTYAFGGAYYDLVLARQRVEFEGRQKEGPSAAVYLIYPSLGLKPSHLRALRYLAANDYSTVVVSNLKLDPQERAEVLECCARYIERPNFGYDFGGYRDGILRLFGQATEFNRIVLLNDSAWFPVSDSSDWLAEVETLGVDFAAAASNFGVPRVDPEDFRDFKFDYRSTHRNFHYTSFALAFGSRIVSDPDFHAFWRRFRLTSRKKRTVKRGEIGLTKWVLKRGYSHGSTLDISGLEAALQKLDDARVRDVARNLIIPEDERMQAVVRSVIDDIEQTARADLEALILTAVARQGASYALAYFNIFEKNFAFLKKSPIWLNERSSAVTLNILDQIGTVAASEARQEALDMRAAVAVRGVGSGADRAQPDRGIRAGR